MLGCCVFKNFKNLSTSDSTLKRYIKSSTYCVYKIISHSQNEFSQKVS